MNALRSLRRGVARNRMKKAGFKQFCKHSHVGNAWQRARVESTFSKKWREFA